MKKSCCSLLMIALFPFAWGQQLSWASFHGNVTSQYTFDHNFIWYSNSFRLIQFDKSNGFRTEFPFPDSTFNLCSGGNLFWNFVADQQGGVWAGATNGLYHFDGYGWTKFPLPDSAMNYIMLDGRDDSGNIFFSSPGSVNLYKFDGNSFTTWQPSDIPGLSKNYIQVLAIDSLGKLWLGNGDTLLVFDGVNSTLYSSANVPELHYLFAPQYFNSVADRTGGVWFTTSVVEPNYTVQLRLFHFSVNGWSQYYIDTISGLVDFNQWFVDDQNSLCTLTNDYILKFDGNTFSKKYFPPNNFDQICTSLLVIQSESKLWFGNWSCDIYSLDSAFTSYEQEKILYGWMLLPMLVDHAGNVWVGAVDEGVSKFDGANWQLWTDQNSALSYHPIYSIAEDSLHKIWAGQDGNRMFVYDSSIWNQFYTPPIDSFMDGVLSIEFDKQGNMWAGGGFSSCGSQGSKGLFEFDGNSWIKHSLTSNGFSTNEIYCLAIDSSQNTWFGTIGDGVGMLNGNTYLHFNTSNSPLPNDTVQCLGVDSLQRIWIGTFNGLAIYDHGNWTIMNTNNTPLPGHDIEYVSFDHDGKALIGTYSGLGIFDGMNWTVFTPQNSPLTNADVESVTEDHNCNLWLATECGLNEISGFCNNAQPKVSGFVTGADAQPISNSLVYLFKINQQTHSLLPLQNTFTNTNGYYEFVSADSEVVVEAIPNLDLFPGQMPAYQDSFLVRQDASALVNNGEVAINLRSQLALTSSGTCKIQGAILQGEVGVNALRIYLMKNNQPVQMTTTNYSGAFAFEKIDTGYYTIWVDKMGIMNQLNSHIELTFPNSEWLNLKFDLLPDRLTLVNPPVTPTFNTEVISFSIEPNPITDFVKVSLFSNPRTVYSFTLNDVLGKQIFARGHLHSESFTLRRNQLAQGIYFYKIMDGNAVVAQGKLVMN